MAWRRWVFPSPTPPLMKSGLCAAPGLSAAESAARCAARLQEPTTNSWKV